MDRYCMVLTEGEERGDIQQHQTRDYKDLGRGESTNLVMAYSKDKGVSSNPFSQWLQNTRVTGEKMLKFS